MFIEEYLYFKIGIYIYFEIGARTCFFFKLTTEIAVSVFDFGFGSENRVSVPTTT